MKKMKKMVIICAILISCGILLKQDASAATKLNKSKTTLFVSGKTTLKVTGTKNKITWSSSNKGIATVTNQGVVTAKKVGKATITAKVGSNKYTCVVTVKKDHLYYDDWESWTVQKGYKSTIIMKDKPGDKITWTSKDKSIATVNNNGVIQGKKEGHVDVIAKCNGKTYVHRVHVIVPRLSQSNVITSVNKKGELFFSYWLLNNRDNKFSWKSSDESIIKITEKVSYTDEVKLGCRYIAKKNGTATITLTMNGVKYKTKITVQDRKNPIPEKNKEFETYARENGFEIRSTGNGKHKQVLFGKFSSRATFDGESFGVYISIGDDQAYEQLNEIIKVYFPENWNQVITLIDSYKNGPVDIVLEGLNIIVINDQIIQIEF